MQDKSKKIKDKNKLVEQWRVFLSFIFYPLSLSSKSGFTLLELTVAMGLFSVAMVMTLGIMVSAKTAREKTTEVLLMQDNIRFSLELLTREMRTGTDYLATMKGAVCSGYVAGSEISFTHYNQGFPQPRTYFLRDTDADGIPDTIMRVKQASIAAADCGNLAVVNPFTDTRMVRVERLRFDVFGNNPVLGSADGQPWVRMTFRARSTNPQLKLQSMMEAQTVVTQRLRDF